MSDIVDLTLLGTGCFHIPIQSSSEYLPDDLWVMKFSTLAGGNMGYFWSHVSTGSFSILGQLFLCPQVVFLIGILDRSLVFLLCAFSPLWYSFQWTQPVLASPEFQLYLLNSRRLMNFTWIYPAWVATWKLSPGNRLGAVGCWELAVGSSYLLFVFQGSLSYIAWYPVSLRPLHHIFYTVF